MNQRVLLHFASEKHGRLTHFGLAGEARKT
jgi:hypothetical protein